MQTAFYVNQITPINEVKLFFKIWEYHPMNVESMTGLEKPGFANLNEILAQARLLIGIKTIWVNG